MGKVKPHEIKNIKRLRIHLGECTVLLKKDGSFPLEKPGTIAAYGSGVRHTVKGGTGSGEVNSRYFVTVEKGLVKAGFTIAGSMNTTASGRIIKLLFTEPSRPKPKKKRKTSSPQAWAPSFWSPSTSFR